MPTENADNSLIAFVQLLSQTPAVAAIVGSRVYGVVLPKGGKKNFPCILVKRAGGQEDQDIPVIMQATFDVRCFGMDAIAANNVYAALRKLNGKCDLETANFYFYQVAVITGPMDVPEQITDAEQWDCVYCTIQAEFEAK